MKGRKSKLQLWINDLFSPEGTSLPSSTVKEVLPADEADLDSSINFTLFY